MIIIIILKDKRAKRRAKGQKGKTEGKRTKGQNGGHCRSNEKREVAKLCRLS